MHTTMYILARSRLTAAATGPTAEDAGSRRVPGYAVCTECVPKLRWPRTGDEPTTGGDDDSLGEKEAMAEDGDCL